MRCDEGKPFCQRCLSTNRRCEGYPIPSTIGASRLCAFGSAEEKRALLYFRERTAPQFSSSYECEFWNRILLRIAEADTGLRHAIVALASLHESFEQTGSQTNTDIANFALQQYNLAIRQHLETFVVPEQDVTVDAYLAPCLVFIFIETFQGHFNSAFSLLVRATKIFQEYKPEDREVSPWPVTVFENLLCRLRSQAISLAGFRALGITQRPCIKAVVPRGIPGKFDSVADAKEFFNFFLQEHFLERDVNGARAGMDEMRTSLNTYHIWSRAFSALLASDDGAMTAQERCAATILEMHSLSQFAALDKVYRYPDAIEDQILWDEYDSVFEKVVSLAESLTNVTQSSSDMLRKKKASVALDLGVIEPLYDTARRCRDPGIRRRAIRVLGTNPCQQGLFDGVLAARVAERAMKIEEAGLVDIRTAADVSDQCRLSGVLATFRPGRQAVVRYARIENSCPLLVRRSFEEVIEW